MRRGSNNRETPKGVPSSKNNRQLVTCRPFCDSCMRTKPNSYRHGSYRLGRVYRQGSKTLFHAYEPWSPLYWGACLESGRTAACCVCRAPRLKLNGGVWVAFSVCPTTPHLPAGTSLTINTLSYLLTCRGFKIDHSQIIFKVSFSNCFFKKFDGKFGSCPGLLIMPLWFSTHAFLNTSSINNSTTTLPVLILVTGTKLSFVTRPCLHQTIIKQKQNKLSNNKVITNTIV